MSFWSGCASSGQSLAGPSKAFQGAKRPWILIPKLAPLGCISESSKYGTVHWYLMSEPVSTVSKQSSTSIPVTPMIGANEHACVPICRHPLLHADYLIQKEAEARIQPQSSRAAAAGPLRRLSNRKDVMARNLGTASDVRTQCCVVTIVLSSWRSACHASCCTQPCFAVA